MIVSTDDSFFPSFLDSIVIISNDDLIMIVMRNVFLLMMIQI